MVKEAALLDALDGMDGIDNTMGLANVEAMDGYMLADKLTPRQFSELAGLDYEMAQVVYAAYATEQGDYGKLMGNISSYKITPLDIRQTAHRQLGTYLGIPQKYYELMRTDAPELLAYNANYWFSQKNELRTLRTMDGCARAFLSNRYRRIDNLDIASVTLPVIGELPEARFVSTQITDDFMYIKVVNPRLQADVVPGDVVQAGVIISNSETGLGSVTIQPLIYRLVCSNGMVINDAKTRRNHVGRAATSEEDFSIYSNETLLADDHAFVLKIKDTVRAAISEARFAQVVSRMRESTEAMLDTKQLPAIVKLASSSFGITEDESNGVLEHLITGGDFSLYGLANAVTRFSQDVDSYDRATKLEEIGYSVMTMSPALFRQMNRTELLAA